MIFNKEKEVLQPSTSENKETLFNMHEMKE